MILTFAQWCEACPSGDMLNHPVVVSLAQAIEVLPCFSGDCPHGGRAFAARYAAKHIAIAVLARIRHRYGPFDNPTGIKVRGSINQIDRELEIDGLGNALWASGICVQEGDGSFTLKCLSLGNQIDKAIKKKQLRRRLKGAIEI